MPHQIPLIKSNEVRTYGSTSSSDEDSSGRALVDGTPDVILEQAGCDVLESILTDEPQDGETEEATWLREIRLFHQTLPWHSKPSIFLLCILISLLCVADMMTKTPFITLQKDKICDSILMSDTTLQHCDKKVVQKHLSDVTSTSLVLSGIISTLLAGKWGALSDRIGRIKIFRYIGIIVLIGTILQYVVILPSTPYHKWILVLPDVIKAIGGGPFAIIANSNSYLLDIVEPEYRTMSISLLMSFLYGSMGLGPIFSSFLIKFNDGNDYVSIYVSLILTGIFIVICSTVMVEPRHSEAMVKSTKLHEKKTKEIENRLDNIMGSTRSTFFTVKRFFVHQAIQIVDVFAPLKLLCPKPDSDGSLTSRYTVVLLVVIDILFLSSTAALLPSLVLYATYQFEWTSVELGYFVSVAGLGRSFVLLVIAPLLLHFLKKWHQTKTTSIDQVDIISIRGSMAMATFGVLLMLATNKHQYSMLLFAVSQALSAICSPTLSGTIIKYCSTTNTGECFGAIALVGSSVMLIISPIILKVYGLTVSFKPELFLYIPLLAGCLSISLTFLLHNKETTTNIL